MGYCLVNDQLIDSYFFNQQSRDLKPIGKVLTAKNDVRRRMGQSLLWYNLNSEDTLYERDSIFSGPESEMQVNLGNELKLNSWAQLYGYCTKVRK